ncbi:UDP-glucose 4-epimerase GalE [Lentisphaera marina]|uniref:UDP-glucose 4-epimerase GalE n=1 Tax=Lentisphaera marina TaxID=1111041 RepID=UPI002366D04F|nr:UDP-glucose 4-epimerase GalE [Lentisphaera marina]MDD7986910.1 UDP-glucose 4-epimerase GalE [Lentisphaera marina]
MVSHAVLALIEQGHQVIVLDNLVYGHREIVENLANVKLIIGDIGDKTLVRQIFKDNQIDAVMHFSAYAYVGESVNKPAKYYQNNVVATVNLLDCMIAANIKTFIFSSTCATYGIPESVPITEDMPQEPINPYGATKLMVERVLADYDVAYGLKSVIFRYFNAAGADPQGRAGENHDPETHLIPLVLEAAAGTRKDISIFGTDYPTEDGTCIRDYIHVSDLADAHLLGLDYLLAGNESNQFNLGNAKGISVKDIITTAEKVTRKSIPVCEEERRAGDPPALVGSADKAQTILGWKPKYPDAESMISHAWNWMQGCASR